MQNYLKQILGIACLTVISGYSVAASHIKAVRVWHSPDSTRIVLDLDKPTEHKLFSLHKPERIVIDLKDTKLDTDLDKVAIADSNIAMIRHGARSDDEMRLVFDLKQSMKAKSFILKPNESYGNRLVIDLFAQEAKAAQAPSKPVRTSVNLVRRNFVVAIDAGHGGEDPGASGHRGTREKDVVLAIARRLETMLKKHPDINPYMTRTGDYYVGLRQRMTKARGAQADLFISIHADAFKDKRATGASVFALSSNGASSEAAKWLAERENRADLIGGVSLDDKSDVLASVLLDLSQTASSEASLSVGKEILGNLKSISPLHSSKVQTAGFAVLKAPDIPSVLIETGFISNPTGEKNLRSKHFQTKMARAILSGVEDFFDNKPKPLVVNARQTGQVKQYKVARGDSLSKIAQKNHTTVQALKSLNRLRSDQLAVGQQLQLP